jgi:YesN/AraC family two-component response regulator
MTGKIIDRQTAGFLVLIIPLAVVIILVFTAWPLILLFFLLTLAVKVWQDYRWSKLSAIINPYFNQLLQDNQGCLTPIDLSVKANLTAKLAKQFLDKKAEEFGAQTKAVGDKGMAYYFITASTLGSIFDESDPSLEAEEKEIPVIAASRSPLTNLEKLEEIKSSILVEEKSENSVSEVPVISSSQSLTNLGKLFEEKDEENTEAIAVQETVIQEPEEIINPSLHPSESSLSESESEVREESLTTVSETILSMSLADLAKRLGVTPAALGRNKKNKTEAEFADWSRLRDPDGVAWKFDAKNSLFVSN